MGVILAPDYQKFENPLVFLAGPIPGAEDWQGKAISLILAGDPSLDIASPRGDYSQREFVYDEQVDWETHYLNEAAGTGGILFWLANEKEHDCGRAFAQTTRFELGEWLTKYSQNKSFVMSIGIEDGLTGDRYLRRRIMQDYTELHISSTLEGVCGNMVDKLNS